MNFFRSILSEDPDPPVPENPPKSVPKTPKNPSEEQEEEEDGEQSDQSFRRREELSSNPDSAAESGGGWSFGGLMKTFVTRSESVIETYRRDLKEFGSGLQKETEAFREVASRAVKDLPASIEVAHGSLETVGHAIDGVWKSTSEIISHGKGALLAPSDEESDSDARNHRNQSLSRRRYSRFDSQLRGIQSDANTYCEEPEDSNDYNKWKLEFVLEEKSEEIKSLIKENGTMEGLYKRVVPNVVDHETFWCRYFYRVDKLKHQEDVRANLVKRAISIDDDEELTWDVDDDDDDEEQTNVPSKGNVTTVENKELGCKELPHFVKEEENASGEEAQIGSSKIEDDKGENKSNLDNLGKGNIVEASSEKVVNEEVMASKSSEVNNAEAGSKSDEKVALDGKIDNGESCKDSDVSIVSTQPSLPEEEGDLGWDEIEDLGSGDEKKATRAGSSNRADLRKRLSAADADDDEDLSWDIEDDDEPVTRSDTK